MKKVANKINMAIIGMMVASPAFAAINESAMCDLVRELGGVFRMLRTFCFIGAAFMIAGWAWGFISAGEAKPDDIKKKGIGLLVGFLLLFGIALILQFLVSMGNGNINSICPIADAFK